MITLNGYQIKQLAEMVDYDDTEITLTTLKRPNKSVVVAYYAEYPEEGAQELLEHKNGEEEDV